MRHDPSLTPRPWARPARILVLALALAAGASPLRAQAAAPLAAAADDSATTTPAALTAGAAPVVAADGVVEGVPPAADSVVDGAATATAPNARMLVKSRRVRLIGKADNVVRAGPGNGFALVGVYAKGMTFTVIARSGEWYDIRLSDTETGWVHASLCVELDDLSGLEFKPNPKLYTRTGTYVASGYTGAYAFDRKSNSLVLGGRIGYYVFDRLQAEAGLSWTHVRRPAEIVESLFALSLEAEDFHMLFYHLNLTWELLPGRQMVPYLSGGVGSTIMLGKAEPAYNYGAGTALFLSRRQAVRWEVRDYRFDSGPEAARLHNNNIEFTLGTELLF